MQYGFPIHGACEVKERDVVQAEEVGATGEGSMITPTQAWSDASVRAFGKSEEEGQPDLMLLQSHQDGAIEVVAP